MFSWIPFFGELANKLLEYEARQPELVAMLRDAGVETGLTDRDRDGQEFPLEVIDPFTFVAQVMKFGPERRQQILVVLKEKLSLQALLPEDFDGVPSANPQRSWFFPYAAKRDMTTVPLLWRFCRGVVSHSIEPDLFAKTLSLRFVGKASLTQAMFWFNPDKYLPLDSQTLPYLQKAGLATAFEDYLAYQRILDAAGAAFSGKKFFEISHEAWLANQGAGQEPAVPDGKPTEQRIKTWLYAPGEGAKYWDEFREAGIMAIGWDYLGDLARYPTKAAVAEAMRKHDNDTSSKKNNVISCYSFANDMQIGDEVFVKQGRGRVLGYGRIQSGYEFQDTREEFKHVRRVEWLKNGDWQVDEDNRFTVKTLTDVSRYPDFVATLKSLVGLSAPSAPPRGEGQPRVPAYWWLNANPRIWNFEETQVGQRQTYTSHNEKGNKRQKYKYFQEVQPGDLVVGYVTSPQKEVIAVCKITRGLHQTRNGEEIEFEKVEQLAKPLSYETLQASPDLAKSEPLISNQGSLFRLTEQEYEIIRSLIDETNIQGKTEFEFYDKKKAMKGLFLAEAQFDEMLAALKEKKNVVLQGAPGVGKTYVARRLAYAVIGSSDPQRTEMIQFHQSFSYEDFIQGFRPTPRGHFDLKYGIFHQFCRRAQREEAQGKPYVFIIDEINRGNLSKIFGELMMLIEPDKRGKEYAIPLAYSQDADERFYIPENLHLIGMMNTADRSLAMVDYALRRRFRFITLHPEFASKLFRDFLLESGASAGLVTRIVTQMTALNKVIAADTKNLGPGYQIGHSYFCPRNGIVPDEDWYRRVVESEIVPLIQEYWFDNEEKVEEQHAALLA